MRSGLVVVLLLLAASSVRAHEERYVFGGAAEQGTFVLDSQTGRVWRYDRVDDAWYLYDLEALVRAPRGESPARSQRPEDKDPAEQDKGTGE
jgi:hypothetical protein